MVQKFRRRLWNPKINYCADNSKPHFAVQSYMKPGENVDVLCLFVHVVTLRGAFAEEFRKTAVSRFMSVGPCARRGTLRLLTEEFL